MTVEWRLRDAAVPARHYRLDHVKRGMAYEISVDFVSDAAEDDVRIWTSIAARMRVKLGTGSYYPVGDSPSTSATLGSFTAGQTKQGTIEVTVPPGVATRHEELAVNLGYGDEMFAEPSYLLFDDFLTDESAPLTSPRTCEPGPGVLVTTDTGNKMSLSGGDLVCTGGSLSWADPVIGIGVDSTTQFTYDAGKCILFDFTPTTLGNARLGVAGTINSISMSGTYPFLHANGNIYMNGMAVIGSRVLNTRTKLLMAQRGYGRHLIRDGKLLWTSDNDAPADRFAIWANYSDAFKLHDFGVLDLPAEGYPEWGPDFSTVTDSASAPGWGTFLDCESDCHIRYSFTFETTKDLGVLLRTPDTNNYIRFLAVGASGSFQLGHMIGGVWQGTLKSVGGVFFDGISYTVDLIAEGTSLKGFVDGVLKIDETMTVLENESGCRVVHYFVTNDIEIETHPYPALGIATTHMITPQYNDPIAHTDDFVLHIRNIGLWTHSRNFWMRGTGLDHSICLVWYPGGELQLQEYYGGAKIGNRIQLGAGTVSDGDDIACIVEGASAWLYVNATQVGSTSAFTKAITGTTGFLESQDFTEGSCDYAEFFPRYVAGLLPGDVV